jgi:hypothetical protein
MNASKSAFPIKGSLEEAGARHVFVGSENFRNAPIMISLSTSRRGAPFLRNQNGLEKNARTVSAETAGENRKP